MSEKDLDSSMNPYQEEAKTKGYRDFPKIKLPI